jgi:5-(aminomethyl)-3-furanmethanol phosphate kinase
VSRIVVVKVGGSLLDWPNLPDALSAYIDSLRPDRVALIVGGGAVVDLLRGLDSVHAIGEKRAHVLALRALELTARLAETLVPGLQVVERPEQVSKAWESRLVPVLSPWWWMANVDRQASDPLPEEWGTTTDSIAARIARDLPADALVLLKSHWPGGTSLERSDASRSGFVDPFFPSASAWLDRVAVINLRSSPPETGVLT